mmetsp:Transcript_616/g.1216  ORF Transcript_616/g.1216 Transcript_616/m.1216 type:complete len:625 (-) Transcript_616:188-2062(-)
MVDGDEVHRLLVRSDCVSPVVAEMWQSHIQKSEVIPNDLVQSTLEALLNAPVVTYLVSVEGKRALEDLYPSLIAVMAAQDAILALGGADLFGERICTRLDEIAQKAFPSHIAAQILAPIDGGPNAPGLEVLRLCVLLLTRCAGGARQLTSGAVLALAGGDMTTAVALCLAVIRNPGSPEIPELQVRCWQILYHYSTPHGATEFERFSGHSTNDVPIQERLGDHIQHLHRMASALVQFDAVTIACSCSEDAKQRATTLVWVLRLIHNLSASENFWASGQLMARNITVHWPRFGFKLLAPHLRRLLTMSEGQSQSALTSQRELRRDLRTVGWLLHHSPGLRPSAKAMVSELAMRAARGAQHAPATLAVVIGAVANAAALEDSNSPLSRCLMDVDEVRKAAVREIFPSEVRRLWVIGRSWQVVEDLGYWPHEEEQEDDEVAKAARRMEEDWLAISQLHSGFPYDSTGEVDDWYENWDACGWNDQGADKSDWFTYEEVSGPECLWGPETDENQGQNLQQQAFNGPLGALSVASPIVPMSPPLGSPMSVTALACSVPPDYRCNIDGRLCMSPVRTPQGILYDKDSISSWLTWNKVCPLTGEPLTSADLLVDNDVASGLSRYLVMHGNHG